MAAQFCGLSVDEYRKRRAAGLKRCTRCKTWKPTLDFYPAKDRSDGLSAACKDCNYTRKTQGEPGQSERRRMACSGLVWCFDCRKWVLESLASKPRFTGRCADHERAFKRAKYRANPEPQKEASRKRRKETKPIPRAERERLIVMFKGRCAYCEVREWEEWEHVIPLAAGGPTKPGNIVPACGHCNSSKKDKELHAWLKKKHMQMPQTLAVFLERNK